MVRKKKICQKEKVSKPDLLYFTLNCCIQLSIFELSVTGSIVNNLEVELVRSICLFIYCFVFCRLLNSTFFFGAAGDRYWNGRSLLSFPFKYTFKAWFLRLSTIDILGWMILVGSGCPAHCRMSSSIPALDPVDASITPRVVTTKNVSKRCQITIAPFWEPLL